MRRFARVLVINPIVAMFGSGVLPCDEWLDYGDLGALRALRGTMLRISSTFILAVAALLAATVPVDAQRYSGYTQVRPGDGLPDIPGGFQFCRLAYNSGGFGFGGNQWSTDYPEAERNILIRLPQLTPTSVAAWSHGEPGYAVVQATDPDLYGCPFLMAIEPGRLRFNQEEASVMRDYLLKGGFLWVDDFWGSAQWSNFASEIRRVLPDYELVDVPEDHPLFNIVYDIPELPQIPSISHWLQSGGGTSERGADSANPSMRAIFDENGRILVLSTHNTDIADGWEREAYDPRYFQLFSPDAYGVAVNIMTWMMTH